MKLEGLVDLAVSFFPGRIDVWFFVVHWGSACSVTLPLGDAWWLGDKEGLLITKTTDAPRLLPCPFFAKFNLFFVN